MALAAAVGPSRRQNEDDRWGGGIEGKGRGEHLDCCEVVVEVVKLYFVRGTPKKKCVPPQQ